MLNYFNINSEINNFTFIRNKTDNSFSNNIPLNNYIHIHLDEKWFKNLYIKSYTDIKPSYESFTEFLKSVSKKNNIVITSGLIDFQLLTELKQKFFYKKNDKIYFNNDGINSIYFIYKPTLLDIESLMRKSISLFVCHGSLTHLANHFNVKIIDIIEYKRLKFYNSYTHYLNNYNLLFRDDFDKLKEKLFELI